MLKYSFTKEQGIINTQNNFLLLIILGINNSLYPE